MKVEFVNKKFKDERVERIRQRWLKFEYKGQSDYDVRFLLRLITGKDPNYLDENSKTK